MKNILAIIFIAACLSLALVLSGCSVTTGDGTRLYVNKYEESFCSNEKMTNCIKDRR